MTNLFVAEALPAWTSNRLSRLIKTPKRYLVDPALMSAALRLDATAIMRDGTSLGACSTRSSSPSFAPKSKSVRYGPRLYHAMEKHGRREIDIVGELGTGIVAVEVKATAAPTTGDAAHLSFMRGQLGDRFLGGAVLHTGPRVFVLSDRILALPICALWGGTLSRPPAVDVMDPGVGDGVLELVHPEVENVFRERRVAVVREVFGLRTEAHVEDARATG